MSTHFRMDDLLLNPMRVETALRDGADLLVPVAEAISLREHLRGAIWTAETIRLTTDIARVIYHGGAMTTDTRDLQGFAASLVFDGFAQGQEARGQEARGQEARDSMATTVIVLVIAAAAVIGFAISHLDQTLAPDLTLRVQQSEDRVTISVA
jgi:hypothetical protein